MRCSRCSFENIPGEKRCLKCGSILEAQKTKVKIHPPRMPAWKRPFRNISRCFRQQRVIPSDVGKIKRNRFVRTILSDELVGLLLSIVPGLAHLLNGRFKEIRLFFIGWLALLMTGLFVYGSSAGFIFLGLAIGVHAWIALRYGLLKELNLIERIVAVLIVFFVLAFIYRNIPGVVFRNFSGSFSSQSIPYYNIKAGDFLLVHRLSDKTNLARGCIVSFHPSTVNIHNNQVTRASETTTGQIIALQGEVVEIKDNCFVVNGEQLNSERFPVPNWLKNRKDSVTVDKDSYFVSSEYNLTIQGVRLTSQHVREVCVVKADNIEARAFMKWWPIWRRGFIR